MLRQSDPREIAEARFLGRLLSGDAAAAGEAARLSSGAFLAAAHRHGVLALLAETLPARAPADVPHAEELHRAARHAAAADLVHERATRDVLVRFAAAGVRTLLIKGADLAYSLYPRPDLRPRVDVDLLAASADKDRAASVLREAGYGSTMAVGDRVMFQEAFVAERGGIDHVVDLHWRVANPERFGHTLAFERAFAESEPRPRLAPEARGLGRIHALALACVHRAAHHYGSRRLIWLYDIDLLARSLSVEEWNTWVDFVRGERVSRVSEDGLAHASDVLGTPVPAVVLDALARTDEPADAAFLDPDARHVNRVLTDLRHTPSWRVRSALLGQHAFPSADYMRGVYAPGSRLPLPLLYTLRIARGARRWLRRG